MKKLIILAAFGVVGLFNAKNVDIKKDKDGEKREKKVEESKMQCMEVGMYVSCTDEMVSDTICWGAGSGTATYEQAVADERHNSQLLTEYICG